MPALPMTSTKPRITLPPFFKIDTRLPGKYADRVSYREGAMSKVQSPELRAVKRIARRRAKLEEEFRQAILDAHAANETFRAIGKAADLTHVRIFQIVKKG